MFYWNGNCWRSSNTLTGTLKSLNGKLNRRVVAAFVKSGPFTLFWILRAKRNFKLFGMVLCVFVSVPVHSTLIHLHNVPHFYLHFLQQSLEILMQLFLELDRKSYSYKIKLVLTVAISRLIFCFIYVLHYYLRS